MLPVCNHFGLSGQVLDFVHLGSAFALRSVGRLGSSLAVLDFVHLGSSLSLRSYGRLGSGLVVLDFVTESARARSYFFS